MSRAVGTSSPALSVFGLRPEAEALEAVPGWGWQLVCEPGLSLSRAPDLLVCVVLEVVRWEWKAVRCGSKRTPEVPFEDTCWGDATGV